MVMKAEPIFLAVESVTESVAEPAPDADRAIVLLSPAGRVFTQAVAAELARRGQPPLVLTSGVLIGADASAALFERTYDDYRARVAQAYGEGVKG